MTTVPPEFVLQHRKEVTLLCRESYLDALLEAGVDEPDALAERARTGGEIRRGRGEVLILPIPGRDERMVVRHYLRGGLLARLNRDLYLSDRRAVSELKLYEAARKAGVPTLTVLAVISRRAWGLFHRLDLITREVPDSRDLLTFFESGPPLGEARAVAAAAAESVRALHDAGIEHADLHLKNLLLAGEKVYLLDLDRARRYEGPLSMNRRVANLKRLDRSLWKRQLLEGSRPVPDGIRRLFLKNYAGKNWRDYFAAFSGTPHSRYWLHRLGWKLGLK